MARTRQRRGNSPLQVFIDSVARLPWWAGVLLAGVSYPVLHRLALPAPSQPLSANGLHLQALVLGSVFTGLATAGQYLVPLLCLMAAGTSFIRRRHRRALATRVTASPGAEAINGLTWQAFEQLVGEAFRQQGYRVEETGGDRGADGGVDLVLRRHHETFFVQCKQWRALKVGVEVVRELYGVMAAHGSAGGFVVTSGRFTAEAQAFAEGRNITLIDGGQLHAMLRAARKAPPVASSGTAEDSRTAPLPTSSPPAKATPSCPACGSAMALRLAKKGRHAGRTFWGCVRFPGCRGVMKMG